MHRILVGLLLSLAGCSSMTRHECELFPWEQRGYLDGHEGKSDQAFIRVRNACSVHAVPTDQAAYDKGYAEGIASYCQPFNGFLAGKRGAAYYDVCPEPLKESFLTQYELGQQYRATEMELKALEDRLETQSPRETASGQNPQWIERRNELRATLRELDSRYDPKANPWNALLPLLTAP